MSFFLQHDLVFLRKFMTGGWLTLPFDVHTVKNCGQTLFFCIRCFFIPYLLKILSMVKCDAVSSQSMPCVISTVWQILVN